MTNDQVIVVIAAYAFVLLVLLLINCGFLCSINTKTLDIYNRLDYLTEIELNTDLTKANTRTTLIKLDNVINSLDRAANLSLIKRFEELSDEEKLAFFNEMIFKGDRYNESN